jgi:hypothetical protein
MLKNKKILFVTVCILIITLSSEVNPGSAKTRAWQHDTYNVGFSSTPPERWYYEYYYDGMTAIYVKYDQCRDPPPYTQQINVTISWSGYSNEWTLSPGSYTSTVFPPNLGTRVKIRVEPSTGTECDITLTIWYYT